MKVQLDKLRLGMSAILQKIYIYIPDPKDPNNMEHKKDVTEDFRRIAVKQIDKLEAENKKLREALEKADYIIGSIGHNTSCEMQNKIERWIETREALK